MSEWISVYDVLPAVLDDVIVCNGNGRVFEASYWSDGEFACKYSMGKFGVKAKSDPSVLYWMPKPEPHELCR